MKIVSNKCVNSQWTADWLAKKKQEACQCVVQCKVLVEYKGHNYVVTKDEYKILKRLNKEK